MVEACLDSVARTAPGLARETVIVDNGSGDGSAEVLRERHPGATLVALEENRGFAAGVNAGMRASRAPYVLLLNPDTVIEPGALEALLARLRADERIAVAAPVLCYPDGRVQNDAYRRFPNLVTTFVDFCLPLGYPLHGTALHPHNVSRRRYLRGGLVARVCGAAMAIRRAAYEDAGPLDEGFFLYFEETEWQQRLSRKGWRIEVVPEARAVHKVRGGGEAAETVSPHYLPSAYRYLRMQGHSERAIDLTLATAAALSRAALWPVAALPPLREKAHRMRAGYRLVSDYVRERRRRSSARS